MVRPQCPIVQCVQTLLPFSLQQGSNIASSARALSPFRLSRVAPILFSPPRVEFVHCPIFLVPVQLCLLSCVAAVLSQRCVFPLRSGVAPAFRDPCQPARGFGLRSGPQEGGRAAGAPPHLWRRPGFGSIHDHPSAVVPCSRSIPPLGS